MPSTDSHGGPPRESPNRAPTSSPAVPSVAFVPLALVLACLVAAPVTTTVGAQPGSTVGAQSGPAVDAHGPDQTGLAGAPAGQAQETDNRTQESNNSSQETTNSTQQADNRTQESNNSSQEMTNSTQQADNRAQEPTLAPTEPGVTSYVGPADLAGNLTVEELRRVAAAGRLERSDTVPWERDVVLVLSARGLNWTVSRSDGRNASEEFRSAVEAGEVTLRAVEAERSARDNPMLNPAVLNLLDRESSQVLRGDGDVYYLVLDTRNVTFGRHGQVSERPLSDPLPFNATFRHGDVSDSTGVYFTAPAYDFGVRNGTLFATTSSAPGTRVDLEIEHSRGERVLANDSATVGPNGTVRFDVDPDAVPWGRPLDVDFTVRNAERWSEFFLGAYVMLPSPVEDGEPTGPGIRSLVAPDGEVREIKHSLSGRELDGLLAVSRSVALNDTLVLVLAAPGLNASSSRQAGDDPAERVRRGLRPDPTDSVSVTAYRADGDGPRKRLDLLDPVSTSIHHVDDDTYVLVVDTGNLDARVDGQRAPIRPGERYVVRLRSGNRTTDRTVAIRPRQVVVTGSLAGNGTVFRSPASPVTVSGRTTLAPGSDIVVQATVLKSGRAVDHEHVHVTGRGRYEAELNLGTAAEGTRVRISVLDTRFDDEHWSPLSVTDRLAGGAPPDEDGTETTVTATPTPTAETETTVPSTARRDAPAGSSTTTGSDTGRAGGGPLPGFGATAAIVAVVVAALLVLRRG